MCDFHLQLSIVIYVCYLLLVSPKKCLSLPSTYDCILVCVIDIKIGFCRISKKTNAHPMFVLSSFLDVDKKHTYALSFFPNHRYTSLFRNKLAFLYSPSIDLFLFKFDTICSISLTTLAYINIYRIKPLLR